MTVEVLDGIHMIQECGPHRVGIMEGRNRMPVDWYAGLEGRGIHIPQNAYLFVGGEGTLLFDTLSPAGRGQVLGDLDRLLGERPLDYLVVSHPDVPHAGNTLAILKAHPGCRLVAPAVGNNHALYHLDESLRVGPGDTLDLGGPRLRFEEATFLDAPISIWMMEERSRTLLPVDWLGVPHVEGECGRDTTELDLSKEEWLSRLIEFHGRVMFWYAYVDAPKVLREIDGLIARLDPVHVAPAHGVFIRDEAVRFMEWMKPVVETIAEHGRVGSLG